MASTSAPAFSDECGPWPKIFCENGVCKNCSELDDDPNAACEALTPDAPVCDRGVCRGCAADHECPQAPEPLLCNTEAGNCQSCADFQEPHATCDDRDDSRPYCIDGACSQCTSNAECVAIYDAELVCTPAGCDACVRHQDCGPDGACDIRNGVCFPPGNATELVTPNANNIAQLHQEIMNTSAGHVIVQFTIDEDMEMTESNIGVSLDIGSKTVAIMPKLPEDAPFSWSSELSLVLEVVGDSDSSLYIDNIEFDASGGSGVLIDTAEAWLDRVTIRNADAGDGLIAEDNVTKLDIRNAIIEGSEAEAGLVGHGLRLEGSGYLNLYYATIVYNEGSISCEGDWGGNLRNSIIGASDLQVGCSIESCGFLQGASHSILELDCLDENAGDSNLGLFWTAWNQNLDTWWGCPSSTNCAFHLVGGCDHPFANFGTWMRSLDAPVDLFGQTRPAAGSDCECPYEPCDFAGANIPDRTQCAPPSGACQ